VGGHIGDVVAAGKLEGQAHIRVVGEEIAVPGGYDRDGEIVPDSDGTDGVATVLADHPCHRRICHHHFDGVIGKPLTSCAVIGIAHEARGVLHGLGRRDRELIASTSDDHEAEYEARGKEISHISNRRKHHRPIILSSHGQHAGPAR